MDDCLRMGFRSRGAVSARRWAGQPSHWPGADSSSIAFWAFIAYKRFVRSFSGRAVCCNGTRHHPKTQGCSHIGVGQRRPFGAWGSYPGSHPVGYPPLACGPRPCHLVLEAAVAKSNPAGGRERHGTGKAADSERSKRLCGATTTSASWRSVPSATNKNHFAIGKARQAVAATGSLGRPRGSPLISGTCFVVQARTEREVDRENRVCT